ncbi:MAG TPA: DUF3857 domain-containing protein [Candidatus Acidoferrum sp.]
MRFSSGKLRLLTSLLLFVWPLVAQEPAQKSADNPQEKPATSAQNEKTTEGPQLPFQIQLLETHIRFEANGDSRKEVHTIVKIINVLGARQFSRVAFDYNRAFQQIDIPLIRISHANGGTSELLPSAVTDALNPAVEKFPAYQDVRVKSVRILGLQEGDTLEYRVITTTTRHPLAPDFWLEHTFDRSGQVLEEHYELDLPGKINPTNSMKSAGADPTNATVYVGVPSTVYRNIETPDGVRTIFQWKIASLSVPSVQDDRGDPVPDVLVTKFIDWLSLATRLASAVPHWSEEDQKAGQSKLASFNPPPTSATQQLRAIYDFVSRGITTVDLPLEATGFRMRSGKEIVDSGYAIPEEKCYVLSQLAKSAGFSAELVFYGLQLNQQQMPRPDFQRVFVQIANKVDPEAFDPSVEVAPFGLIPAQFRGKPVISLSPQSGGDYAINWIRLPETIPFRARQLVDISAELSSDGKLTAKVKYTLRGDNELLLRVAFHQTSKDKWKDVAGLLAISDGFRGQVTSVTASDPTATKDPFTVEYEITQPKFVDWTKNPVRIPALLPQIGVPDPPSRNATGPNAPKIELGTPLEVDTHVTVHLPAGTTVEAPAGTSVKRDYATFSSTYSAKLNTLTAARHVDFLARELPADRAADYNAFFRTIQNDQTQHFTLFAPPIPASEPPKSPEKQKSSP